MRGKITCTKKCVTCGQDFVAHGGRAEYCPTCKSRPCPRCGGEVKKWCRGVCDNCATKDYHETHRKEREEYSRKRYRTNPEKFKNDWVLYRTLHPDKIKAYTARYVAEHREEMRERDRLRGLVLRFQMVEAYGGKCECCGETEPKFLCIHHTRGDGKVDRAQGFGGIYLFARLRRESWPKDGYALLCHNCNEAVKNLGVCPHQQAGG